MALLVKSISILLFLALLFTPFLFAKYGKNQNSIPFFKFLVYTIICSGVLAILAAWWSNYSNLLLLQHYGYDATAMSEAEQYKNVALHDLKKVKTLKISLDGIGWPVKLAMDFPWLILYNLIVFWIMKFYYRNRQTRVERVSKQ